MKTLTLLLSLFFLPPAAFGQEAVEPIRVSIMADEKNPYTQACVKEMRVEMTKNGRVALLSKGSARHIHIVITAAPAAGNGCNGFAAAMIVSSAAGPDNLSVYVSGTLKELSRTIVEDLEQEYFHVDVNGDGCVGPKDKDQPTISPATAERRAALKD